MTNSNNAVDNASSNSTAITVNAARGIKWTAWDAFLGNRIKTCEQCGNKFKRHRLARFCFPCTELRARSAAKRRRQLQPDKSAASALVAKAIRDGLIPPASDRPCADCLKPAEVYDHRDYRYPLQVEPVCHPCNIRRGPGYPYNQ